jgi:hypothetical protein
LTIETAHFLTKHASVDRDNDNSANVAPAMERSMHTGIIQAIPGSTLAKSISTHRKALNDNQNAYTTTATATSMLAQNVKLLVRNRASAPDRMRGAK